MTTNPQLNRNVTLDQIAQHVRQTANALLEEGQDAATDQFLQLFDLLFPENQNSTAGNTPLCSASTLFKQILYSVADNRLATPDQVALLKLLKPYASEINNLDHLISVCEKYLPTTTTRFAGSQNTNLLKYITLLRIRHSQARG